MTDKTHSTPIEVIEAADLSPDVGLLVWRGDFLYTEHGEVIPSNALVRLTPMPDPSSPWARVMVASDMPARPRCF